MGTTMRIGIMSREDFKKYTIAVARGEIHPTGNEPKIWFESIESMAQVLSTKNQELLRTIKEKNPQSLSELAITSGRRVSNLSRTLSNMEKYGIVKLSKDNASVKPHVCIDKFDAVFGI